MAEKGGYDQQGQEVRGNQTDIGVANASVFSGQFMVQGDFIYNEATKVRLPFQRPPRVAHFTGREAELATLLQDLQPRRAVTICGPGGMGKTALSAEAIWKLAPGSNPPEKFPDGIIFHTFYHRPQAALALEAFARAYGEDPRQSPLDAAKKALAGRIPLVVLDGAEACDDLPTVLSVTGSCGVLITTRRHSDAPEDFSDLPPLPEDKAIELLQAWGKEMASDMGICRSICSLLGSLPLAIFLAGRYLIHRRQLAGDYLAWLKETPLDALDQGKREHQSIALLMEHSLEQVSDQACACLGLAGVLAMKSFQAEIMAEGLQISLSQTNISLGELVDYGLLIRPDMNYQITHALAHTYARERLVVAKDALARLAGHYNEFSREQVEQGLKGYARLDAQRDHILAVQSACNNSGLWKEARSIVRVLRDYLDLQGHWLERIALVQSGLQAARSDGTRYDEASFLNTLGQTYSNLGEPRKAIEFYEQALAIAKEIGYRRGEGGVLGNLGQTYSDLGEPRKAIEFYEQALAIAREFKDREIKDKKREGIWLGNLGIVHSDLSEPRQAIGFYQQALAIAKEIGDRRSEGNALGNLGLEYYHLGEKRKAIEFDEQALAIAKEIGDKKNEGTWLGNLGIVHSDLGEPRQAIDYYEQALAIAREIGDRRGEGNALFNTSLALDGLGKQAEAAKLAADALAIYKQIKSPVAEQVRRKLEAWQG